MASPVLRDTIKKLKERRTLLRRQVKGPLAELDQIEADLQALGAGPGPGASKPRALQPSRPAAPRAPRGANQAAILRAIRDGATTREEIVARTGLASRSVASSIAAYVTRQRLVTSGLNGLTLTRSGRDRLRELEGR